MGVRSLQVLWVVSTVVVVAVATPRFLVAVPIIVAFYTYVQNFYVPASRELKVRQALCFGFCVFFSSTSPPPLFPSASVWS